MELGANIERFYYPQHISEIKAPKVLTFGVFDLLHAGHIHFLKQCTRYGEVIVATADDETVSMIKGKNRPIYPLSQRIEMLKATRYVSEVVPFRYTAETMLDAHRAVIKKVKPDVFVQGEQASHAFMAIVDVPIRTVESIDVSTSEIISRVVDRHTNAWNKVI